MNNDNNIVNNNNSSNNGTTNVPIYNNENLNQVNTQIQNSGQVPINEAPNSIQNIGQINMQANATSINQVNGEIPNQNINTNQVNMQTENINTNQVNMQAENINQVNNNTIKVKPRIVTPQETNMPSNFATEVIETIVTNPIDDAISKKKKTNPLMFVIIFVLIGLFGVVGYWVYDTYFKVYTPVITGYQSVTNKVLATYNEIKYLDNGLIEAVDSDGNINYLNNDGTLNKNTYFDKLNNYEIYKENSNYYYKNGDKKSDMYTEINVISSTDYLYLNLDNKISILNTKTNKITELDCLALNYYKTNDNRIYFSDNNYVIAAKSDQSKVLFDYSGKIITNANYSDILPVDKDVIIIEQNDLYGIINSNEETKLNIEYNFIKVTNNYILCIKDNKLIIYSKDYKLIKDNVIDIKGLIYNLDYNKKDNLNNQFTINEVNKTIVLTIHSYDDSSANYIYTTYFINNKGEIISTEKGRFFLLNNNNNPIYYKDVYNYDNYYKDYKTINNETITLYSDNKIIFTKKFSTYSGTVYVEEKDNVIYLRNNTSITYLDSTTKEKLEELKVVKKTLNNKCSYAYLKSENRLVFYNETNKEIASFNCTSYSYINDNLFIVGNKLMKIEYTK